MHAEKEALTGRLKTASNPNAGMPPPVTNTKPECKRNTWIRVFVFIALLIGSGLYFARHPERLPTSDQLKWNYFSWIILLSALANVAAAKGYCTIVQHCDSRLNTRKVIRAFIISRSLNLISPQGGTVYRAVALKTDTGFSYTRYTSSMTVCLWLDLTLASFAAALSLLFIPPSHERTQLISCFVVACLCSITAARILPTLSKTRFLEKIPLLPRRIKDMTTESLAIAITLINKPRLLLHFGSWALTNTLLHGTRLWLCFAMVEAWIPWPKAFSTSILVKASNTISITPGNLGIIESIVGIMGTGFGLSLGGAVLAALIYRFASYIALLTMSACLLIWNPSSGMEQ